MTRLVITILLVVSFLVPAFVFAEPGSDEIAIRGTDERFGVSFVNNMDNFASDRRYQQAVDAGAKWTRWPIYWHLTEENESTPDYSTIDAAISRDHAAGLKTNAILLGTPGWACTSGSTAVALPEIGAKRIPEGYGVSAESISSASSVPRNLYAPVFNANGTINQNNYWARFVFNTVSRYKNTVKVWEMWNEPDLRTGDGQPVFWGGSREDYYQLLKVGYLAAKKADPNATILFAGLAFFTDQDFFPGVLDIMARDSGAPANNYYFDVIAWHPYVRSYYAYEFPVWSRTQMTSRGIPAKKVWINETNIPVCDDSSVDPGLWCPSRWRGSMDEQAAFVIQAFAMGIVGGAEKIFIFQLYDDDVGPHDWYGLIRNDGRTRPGYTAYQVAATYLANPISARRESTNDIEKVVLDGTPRGRVTVVWNRGPERINATIPASAGRSTVVDKYGNTQSLLAVNGSYTISLPGATYRDEESGRYDIGGSPYILIEQTTYLSGTVWDNLGIPVPGAVVTVSSPLMTTTTDGQGRYFFETGGSFDLTAGKSGYGTLPGKALAMTSAATYNFVLPPLPDHVQNGGFESALAGWSVTGEVAARSYRHTGQQGIEMKGGRSSLSQTVNIPAETTNPTLSFTYRIPSAVTGNLAWIAITGSGGTKYHLIQLRAGDQWKHGFASLSGMSGATQVTFNLIQGAGSVSPVLWLDEVSVGAARNLPYKIYAPISELTYTGGW